MKTDTGKFRVKEISMKKRKEKLFECKECGAISQSIVERNKHLLEIHGISDFRCGTCGEMYDNENTLKRHMNTHDEELRGLKCARCDNIFFHRSQLNRHMLKHSDDVFYKCPFKECVGRKGFKSIYDYKMHKETHSGRTFACGDGDCKYVGLNKHQLSDHKRRQHGPKRECPFKVHGCEFWCREKTKMRNHLDKKCKYKNVK